MTQEPATRRIRRDAGPPAPGEDPRNPFGLEAGLARDLAALADAAERAHAAYRPEVVRHLFEGGWRPLHARLGGAPEGREALTAVWRLMLESVVTGRFGVSSDAWRANEAYPDRFFPRLWLDVLPAAPLAAGELALAAAELFNLGERLHEASRAASNAVAESLHERRARLAGGGWREAAREGLVRAGLLRAEAAPPSEWRRARRIGVLRLGDVDPAFVVGAVRLEGEEALLVDDAARDVRATAAVSDAGIEVVSLGPRPAQGPSSAPAPEGWTLRLDGRMLVLRLGGEARELVRVGALLPLPLAAHPSGLVAVGDALSQHVEAWRAGP